MSKSVYESLFNVLILIVLVYFVVNAFTLSGGAGRVPLFVGIPTLILMCLNMVKSYIRKRSLNAESRTPDKQHQTAGLQHKILLEILWLSLFMMLILFLGVLLGSLAFVILYLRVHNKDSWIFSIAVSLAVVLGAYLLFQYTLKIRLYEGILPNIVSGWFDY